MAELPRRVTQSDVARQVGVNRATVSLALRNHPGIPETTRSKIEKAAAELGYVPDPMLSALANYRTQNRTANFRGTIAWFAETTRDYRWRDVAQFTTYLASAERSALKFGYKVEVFDITQMGVSWERAAAIAKARGVNGILICPQARSQTFLDSFPWAHFSAVTFGYSLQRPQLHAVTTSHYRAVLQIMRQLHQRGYQRIGFAHRPQHDARLNHTFLAGYLTAGHLTPSFTLLPVCPDDGHESDGKVLRAWLREHKPDALITANPEKLKLLEKWDIAVPDELGVACVGIPHRLAPQNAKKERASAKPPLVHPGSLLSGVTEDDERIGEVAVDLLISMIQRGERGVPAKPQRVLVEGTWHDGNSLRAATETPVAPAAAI